MHHRVMRQETPPHVARAVNARTSVPPSPPLPAKGRVMTSSLPPAPAAATTGIDAPAHGEHAQETLGQGRLIILTPGPPRPARPVRGRGGLGAKRAPPPARTQHLPRQSPLPVRRPIFQRRARPLPTQGPTRKCPLAAQRASTPSRRRPRPGVRGCSQRSGRPDAGRGRRGARGRRQSGTHGNAGIAAASVDLPVPGWRTRGTFKTADQEGARREKGSARRRR